MNRVIALALLTATLTGCGSSKRSSPTTPSDPPGSITVLQDSARHHLGDDVRSDFVQRRPESLERAYTFELNGPVQSGFLRLNVYDMNFTGAFVAINGIRVLKMPPPNPTGTAQAAILASVFRTGTNTLVIRCFDPSESIFRNENDPNPFEDFEYDGLLLTTHP